MGFSISVVTEAAKRALSAFFAFSALMSESMSLTPTQRLCVSLREIFLMAYF
ncbi:MAG: hypothetical protein K2M31_01615 [Muribaculaceae bacterium]|nr:hypothetical protein [Muribaculaceae bacterium]